MKIVFICGSLEEGKDGVGDYTRRLACELIRRGHEIKILAINDKCISAHWNGMQTDTNINVPVERLSSNKSWQDRIIKAQEYISYFAPDWISLQFVIFIFHPKGIPVSLFKQIKKLNHINAKWHIMFHELWVGMDDQATLKFKLLGAIQKQILYSFLKKLQPSVIHTHAFVYQYQLTKLRFKSKALPLFTNLVVDRNISKVSEEIKKDEKKHKIIFSLFGGIHSGAPIEQFAKELNAYKKENGINIEVRIIGRSGSEKQKWFDVLQKANINTIITGQLSSENVTLELLNSHYGLSTTPILLAGKSSAIATMLGHGLPVICVTKRWTVKEINEPNKSEAIFDYKPTELFHILNTKINDFNIPTLERTVDRFTQDLLESSF